MRKLKLQVQISVDGYIAANKDQTDWLVWAWGPQWIWDQELQKYFIEMTSSVDCVLLSRKMAEEGFIGHWARVAANPDDPQFPFAKKIADAHKVVFTKTLKKSAWDNTKLATGDLVAEINKLKNQEGKDIIVYGGASFLSSLIKAGLVDEFQLFVNPAALGSGKPIFNGLESKLGLSLVKAQAYECGVAVLVYRNVVG